MKGATQLLKKIVAIIVAVVFVLALIPQTKPAEAAASYTYVKANYSETTDKKGNVTRTLKSVTVKKGTGQNVTFLVNNSTLYFINNTKTTVNGLNNPCNTCRIENND